MRRLPKSILAILLLSPISFGSARPILVWLWVLVVALSCCIFSFRYIFSKSQRYETSPNIQVSLSLAAVMFTAFVALTLGSVHLPISDQWDKLANLPHEPAFATVLGWRTLASIWSHIILIFLIVLRGGGDSRTVIKVFAALATTQALYGLIQFYLGNEYILWFDRVVNLEYASGTFVNRNSFAAYLGLGALCTAVLFIERIQPAEKRKHVSITTFAKSSTEIGLYVFSAICIVGALLHSQSRAGILTTFVGLGVLLILSFLGRLSFSRVLIYGSNFIAVFLLLIFLSGSLLDRFISLSALDMRVEAYKSTLDAISKKPLLGYGIGSFKQIFPVVRSEDVRYFFARAHNDYLELTLEVGLIGVALLFFVLLFLARTICKKESLEQPICLLILAMCVQLGLHALVDFPFQIPAISYVFAIFLGVAISSQCQRRTKNHFSDSHENV